MGRLVIHTRPDEERVRFIALYVACMMAVIPLFNLNIMGFGLFLLLGAGLVILTPFAHHNFQASRVMLFYYLFVIYDLLTFAWAPGNADVFQYLKMILFFILVTTIVFSKKEIKVVLLLQLVMGTVVAIILCTTNATMTVQGEYFTDTRRAVLRVGGQLIDPNYSAMLMFPLSVFAMRSLLSKGRVFTKMVSAVLLLLCLYACLRSGTRGGLMAILGGLLYYFLSGRTGIARKIGVSLFAAVVFITVLPALIELLPASVQRRFSIEKIIMSGGGGRADIWKACLSGAFDSILTFVFGHGKGATITNIGMAAHNFFLDQLYNGGIIELILLLQFELSLFFRAKSNNNSFARALLVAYLIMTMTVSVGANMYFWTGIALVVLLSGWDEALLNPFSKSGEGETK